MAWPDEVQYAKDSNGNVIGLVDGNSVIGLAQSYTWATKPLASEYIGTALISDIGGGTYWVSNGDRWRPMNGRCLLSDLSADITTGVIPVSAIGSSVVVKNISIPENFWQNGDTIAIRTKAGKNGGTTDNIIMPYFISTNTAIGTNLIVGGAQVKLADLAAAAIMNASYHRFQRISATSLRFLGNASGANENTTSTNPFLITGLPNMDNAFNFQICAYKASGTSNETVTLMQAQAEIESVLGVL